MCVRADARRSLIYETIWKLPCARSPHNHIKTSKQFAHDSRPHTCMRTLRSSIARSRKNLRRMWSRISLSPTKPIYPINVNTPSLATPLRSRTTEALCQGDMLPLSMHRYHEQSAICVQILDVAQARDVVRCSRTRA